MRVVVGEEFAYRSDGRDLIGRVQAVEIPADHPTYRTALEAWRSLTPNALAELRQRVAAGDSDVHEQLDPLTAGMPLRNWLHKHPDLVIPFKTYTGHTTTVSLGAWRDEDPDTTLIKVGMVAVLRDDYESRRSAGKDPFGHVAP
jgi:hypothetical protein